MYTSHPTLIETIAVISNGPEELHQCPKRSLVSSFVEFFNSHAPQKHGITCALRDVDIIRNEQDGKLIMTFYWHARHPVNIGVSTQPLDIFFEWAADTFFVEHFAPCKIIANYNISYYLQ
jgi:hypothetical protein